MTKTITRRVPGAAAVAAALALALPLLAGVPAAHADGPPTGYPSWSDVQQAKSDQADAQAEADRISKLIDGLESKAAELGGVAVRRAAESAQAQANLAAAQQKADALADKQHAAEEEAKKTRTHLGALTAELYRAQSNGTSLRIFLEGKDADSLLYRLGTMTRITDTVAALRAKAESAENLVTTLSDQAASARDTRDRLAKKAEEAAAAAKAASEAADAELAKQKKVGKTLYAQLAYLKDTTAKVEKKYQAGVRARAAYKAQQEAARRAAERRAAERRAAAQNSGGGGGSSSGGGGGATGTAPPPAGITVDPAAARSYARASMGSYGWGSGQFHCLVLLWDQESGWRADAYNLSSGAYGIAQALPGSKMASAGADWRTNARTQINWGLGYISSRYGSPCGAWSHEGVHNWY